jgi:hypothetical protein
MAGMKGNKCQHLTKLVDEVKANLQGYALRQDRITYVANPAGLTTTSTSITVGSSSNLAKGIIEIDDELIWIDSFDKTNNVMNVIPGFGRGYQGTTASPHAQYAPVTLSPTFHAVTLRRLLTIRSIASILNYGLSTLIHLPLTHLRSHIHCQMMLRVSYLSLGRPLVLAKNGSQ